jgi:hypothetical protein
VLEEQTRRMLADPKAKSLIDNFASQWMHLRDLENAAPESPDFDGNLRLAFSREMELFFESILRDDRSIVTLLDADYTFVDERLARHYGMPNIKGSFFRRVTLARDDPSAESSAKAVCSWSRRPPIAPRPCSADNGSLKICWDRVRPIHRPGRDEPGSEGGRQ